MFYKSEGIYIEYNAKLIDMKALSRDLGFNIWLQWLAAALRVFLVGWLKLDSNMAKTEQSWDARTSLVHCIWNCPKVYRNCNAGVDYVSLLCPLERPEDTPFIKSLGNILVTWSPASFKRALVAILCALEMTMGSAALKLARIQWE